MSTHVIHKAYQKDLTMMTLDTINRLTFLVTLTVVVAVGLILLFGT